MDLYIYIYICWYEFKWKGGFMFMVYLMFIINQIYIILIIQFISYYS